MPTDAEIKAAATALYGSLNPSDKARAMARRALGAAEVVRAAEKRRTCKHEGRIGHGSVSSDGSSSMSWHCPACGESGESSTPPRTDGEGMRAMLSNLPR